MKKILLVDDEADILSLILATLGGDGRYQVLLAQDGEEAIEVAREEKPDLLLLDIMMPKKDGFEVCRMLKSDPETAKGKVIMVTALAQEADLQRALAAGADDYITKPFSPIKLISTVERFLNDRDV